MHQLSGKKIGSLTILKEGKRKTVIHGIKTKRTFKLRRWWARCKCGNKKLILQNSLLSGKTISCGCRIGTKIYRHGMSFQNYDKVPIAYKLWQAAKRRAKVKKIEFTIDVKDIVVTKRYPVFNIELKSGKGPGCKEHSPSLDRIDNKKGYTKENTWVISGKANKAKSTLSVEEIFKLAKILKKKVQHG